MQKAGFMKFLVRSGLVALLCTSFQVYSQQESKTDQGIQAQVSEENDDEILLCQQSPNDRRNIVVIWKLENKTYYLYSTDQEH